MIAALSTSPAHVSSNRSAPVARAHGPVADYAHRVAAELRVAAAHTDGLDVDGVQHESDHGILA